MRVVLASGESIELGDVETAPTIGMTDYSRRVTDDFGVTTVVERGFSRRMTVKLGVPFDQVDALQRRLADLRATAALWVADDRFASFTLPGFYKDFDIDLAVPPLSYCTLTVEGLAEAAAPADAGGEPTPLGIPSTLQLLQPVVMTNSVLAASNVAENDAAEWAGATSYPTGARVMKAAILGCWLALLALAGGGLAHAQRAIGRAPGFRSGFRFASFVPIAVPGIPPTDWRRPVIAAYDSAGDATLVTALTNSSTNKTLPAYAVAASSTRTIAYKLPAAAENGFVYFVNEREDITLSAAYSTDTTDGLTDGTWTTVPALLQGFRSSTTTNEMVRNNGQWFDIPAFACTVRFSVTTGTTGRSITGIGVFRRLALMDSTLFSSMSIYADNFKAIETRAAAIAANPGRDPIIFNWSVSGGAPTVIAAQTQAAADANIPVSALVSAQGANGWSQPYSSETTANIKTKFRDPMVAVAATAASKSWKLYFNRESFRFARNTTGAPEDVAAYNLNLYDPYVSEFSPFAYNSTYAMGYFDAGPITYGTIADRGPTDDGTHGAAPQWIAEWVRSDYRHWIFGLWPTNLTETYVAAYEPAANDQTYYPALNRVALLPASVGKTALQSRLVAKRKDQVLADATDWVSSFETTRTQYWKDMANARIATAAAAGNSVTALQSRVAAVTVRAGTAIQLHLGSSSGPAGWVNDGQTVSGAHYTDLLDSAGISTGISMSVNAAPTLIPIAAVSPAENFPFSGSMMTSGFQRTGGGPFTISFAGIPAGKVVDVLIWSERYSGVTVINHLVNGAVVTADFDSQYNNTRYTRVTGAAVTSGAMTVGVGRGAGNSGSYAINGVILVVRDA